MEKKSLVSCKSIAVILAVMWCFGIIMVSSPPVFCADKPLIINRASLQEFDKLTTAKLAKAKELTVHYATGDIGMRVITGLLSLESSNNKYSVAVMPAPSSGVTPQPGDLPDVENPPALRICLKEGSTLDDYWLTDEGIENALAFADSGQYQYSMWVWPEENSDYEDELYIMAYLDIVASIESVYYDVTTGEGMRFIFTTRYVANGGSIADNDNQLIRDFCTENNMILFDFDDIGRYAYEINFPMEEVFAKAFWVMMAKLANKRMLGDVDGDGRIIAYDAALTAMHIVKLRTLTGDGLWAANVDGDTNTDGSPRITVYDAALIARRAVKLIDKFPAE